MSSANKRLLENLKICCKSFINNTNNNGPRCVPWGIPEKNSIKRSEEKLPIRTVNFLLVK